MNKSNKLKSNTEPITLDLLKKKYKIIKELKTTGSSRSIFYIVEPIPKLRSKSNSKSALKKKGIVKIIVNEQRKTAINEINVNRNLSKLNLPFFPKFIESGEITLRQKTRNLSTTLVTAPYFISEYVEGIPLIKAFTDKSLEKRYKPYYKMILFQILYSVFGVLDKNINFQHNDLHPNNIIISSTESFDNEVIEVGNNLYCLSGPIVKIIDFGRSSFKNMNNRDDNDDSDKHNRNMTHILLNFIDEQMNESNIIKYSKKLKEINSDIRFWVYMKLALSKKFANLDSDELNNLPDWTICRQLEKCLNHPYFDSFKCGTIEHIINKNNNK